MGKYQIKGEFADLGKITTCDDIKIGIFSHPHKEIIDDLREPTSEEKKIPLAIKEVFDDPNVQDFGRRTDEFWISVHLDGSIGIDELRKLEKKTDMKVTVSHGLYSFLFYFTPKDFVDYLEEATQ